MEQQPILNEHNKQEYPPMHTCEHIVNRTMDRLYHCGRAVSAHIERKKSKLDYALPAALTDDQIRQLEETVNEVIDRHLDVTVEYMSIDKAAAGFDLTRLPGDVSDTVRVVRVGDYDECLCLGTHVSNTSEIGHFKVTTCSYENGIFRIRFKLI
ncbi:MAG TPA: hypothetical protein IAA93_06845 [Candidatus Avibacteroides avistercoris]|uniref:Threonyl/alanyl tRNA synthetase SAD domain-containing protein n=1 Tax=Candidatus Avibacteroides avistercoris TaxID=2840690 RepID=A0A9D2ZVD0_9BACT|nr:hypothetical protein [Candidatus Avibacteroides avistercoris]